MNRLAIITAATAFAFPAFAQAPMPAPSGPTYKLELSEPEINTTVQLLDRACMAVGTGGGCREAIYLIDKFNEAKKPKVAPAPAAAEASPKK